MAGSFIVAVIAFNYDFLLILALRKRFLSYGLAFQKA